MPNELLLEDGSNLLLEDDSGSYPYSFLLLEDGYDPSPYQRVPPTNYGFETNDHGTAVYHWDYIYPNSESRVYGAINADADTYAARFDVGEILPSTGYTITGIEIKLNAYSPNAQVDLSRFAYGPKFALYKNDTYQSVYSSGANYVATTSTQYTTGNSTDTMGVTWAAGDTFDFAVLFELYDNTGSESPYVYFNTVILQIWYTSTGGGGGSVSLLCLLGVG